MEILKLAAVLAVIVAVLWAKKPLWAGMLLATLAMIPLFSLPLQTAGQALWTGAVGWQSIEALLVLYAVTYLQRMMEERDNLKLCQQAMNGLFNNRRINASLVPCLMGCLPAGSAVLICGPIVRESVGDALAQDEQAALTSYFRHITESILPTFTGVYIAIAATGGAVSASTFVTWMLPMAAALFFAGWLVYLRRLPRDTGMVADQSRGTYWRLLGKSVWPVALAIALILLLHLPVELGVLAAIAVNIFVERFTPRELTRFLTTAFEWKLMLSTWLIMIFKEVLSVTGVIEALPSFFEALPIPTFLVFALIFFFGTIAAGNKAICALGVPLAMAAAGGRGQLSLFVLLMCVCHAASQLSTTHVCLTICAEDFHVSLGAMMRRSLPMVAVFLVMAFGYYFLLSVAGL